MDAELGGRRRRRMIGCAVALLSAALTFAVAGAPCALAADPLKIAVLTDSSGNSASLSGNGAIASAELALQDFGPTVLGRPITLLKGDHRSNADVGVGLARQFYDDNVRAIFDIGITTVAIGTQRLAREKDKIAVFTSTGTVDMTGKWCSPNGIQWTYDSHAFAVSAARANMPAGGKKWFFLTVDYAYGTSLQEEATRYIVAHGGTVLGAMRHPFEAKDFASDILKAQVSGADIIGLATPTSNIANIIKQAADFGITGSGQQRLAPIGMLISDVKGLGLQTAQNLLVSEPYYWDQDDATRRFGERFRAHTGFMPNSYQASVYGAVMHYLNAVKQADTEDTNAVLAVMKSTPVNDFMTHDGRIRPDGRLMRDFYVFRVKTPAESKSDWDLYQQVMTIPPDEAFKAPDPACPLVK